MTGTKRMTIVVAGRGDAAKAVMDALAVLPGVGTVRQIGQFDPLQASRQLAGTHLMVDMIGGVAPAFAACMAALAQGVACVTANPLLVATHGRVLQNAAQGQHTYFGFQAAGFGMPVAEMMMAMRPQKVTACFTTAASMAMARMSYRNESLAHVSAHLKMTGVDMSDWGGKVTQARAMALRALWHSDELRGQQVPRVGVESMEPADVKRMREFGLYPVFGAEITEDGIYTGPLAVAHGSPLLAQNARDVLLAQTELGDVVLAQDANEDQRMVGGVVADVRTFMRASKPALMQAPLRLMPMGGKAAERAYVRIPFAAREEVLAFRPEIMDERMDGDGLWQAVVAVEEIAALKLSSFGGMIFPLVGAWAPPTAGSVGLRLVG
ncbi:MAG: hypothetical protein EON60_06870 [Alphaproteobacteria bacterium]|nr:MAG: hypothetical protein EON60_06870 [Alphaproteobacteria bacterium]